MKLSFDFGKLDEGQVEAWVEFLMPLIEEAALPLRAISQEHYEDGVQDGILFAIECLQLRGNFNPRKGNLVDYLKKALPTVRMAVRADAQAGTQSVEQKQGESEDGEIQQAATDDGLDMVAMPEPEDEAQAAFCGFASADDLTAIDTQGINHPFHELFWAWRMSTVPLMPDVPEKQVVDGDPNTTSVLFTVPAPVAPRVYVSEEVRFTKAGKPVARKVVKAKVAVAGAAVYGDDDEEFLPEALDYDDHGELEDDAGMADFPGFMAQQFDSGLYSSRNFRGLPRAKCEKKLYFMSLGKDEHEDDEEEAPEDVKIALPVHLVPLLSAHVQAMREFQPKADLVRHVAWVTNSRQPIVVVEKLTRKGLVTSKGAVLPLSKAAGIAMCIRPASGDTAKMLEAVSRTFEGDNSAALFVQRHQQYAALVQ